MIWRVGKEKFRSSIYHQDEQILRQSLLPVTLTKLESTTDISQFGGSDDSGSEFDENDSSLPFPKPLSRSAFLTPDFDSTTFLSTLSNRHQTLEDLRVELKELSQSLNKELLDLVNENYRDFLSLGGTLKGGEEKVEEVRVGLLGFQRDVGSVREKVEGRRKEVGKLLKDRQSVQKRVGVGRQLLEVAERIDELEANLMIGEKKDVKQDDDEDGEIDVDSQSEDSDEDDRIEGIEDGPALVPIKRLDRHTQQYLYVKSLAKRIGPDHPFLIQQEERILRIRTTMLLDLSTALKQAKQAGEMGNGRLVKILRLYDTMSEEGDAVAALKG